MRYLKPFLILILLLHTCTSFAYKTKVETGVIELTPTQKDVHYGQQRTPYGQAAILKLSSGSKVTLTKKYFGQCTHCPNVKPGDENRWAESIRLAQKQSYGALIVHEVLDRNGDTLNPDPYQIFYLALPKQGKLVALPCDKINGEAGIFYDKVEIELSDKLGNYSCIGKMGGSAQIELKMVSW